jgi:outer membrane protein OmpA-like peptidoglycan-associated protein
MQKTKVLLILLSALISEGSFAQFSLVPQSFENTINTSADERYPILSSQGDSLFFSRRTKNTDKLSFGKRVFSVWFSVSKGGRWQQPRRLPELNIGRDNRVVSIFENGNALLLMHDGNVTVFRKERDTWIAVEASVFSQPDVSLGNDGTRAVFTRNGKLYYSERSVSDDWLPPRQITLTGFKRVAAPTVVDDGVVFAASREPYGVNVYRAPLLADAGGDVTVVRESLHSSLMDLRTTANGSRAVYARTTPAGNSDLFFVKIYEDDPHMYVRGNITNRLSRRPITNRDIRIMVNGLECDDALVNKDSGSYSLRLPLGAEHVVEIQATFYDPHVFRISTMGIVERLDRRIDATLEPTPYVMLRGTVTLGNSANTVPSGKLKGVMVNEVLVESATHPSEDAMYRTELPFGRVYKVKAVVEGVPAVEHTLDLRETYEYDTISLNLETDDAAMTVVRAVLTDASTGKTLSSGIPVKMKLHKSPNAFLSLYASTAACEIRFVSPGAAAFIASAQGYCPSYNLVSSERPGTVHQQIIMYPAQSGSVVRLNHVNFELGRTNLEAGAEEELELLVQFLNDFPEIKIEIGVHTHRSSIISTLSRAKVIAAYLLSKGIAPNRVTTRGYGATKPIVPHEAADGRQRNTRVEYTILGE